MNKQFRYEIVRRGDRYYWLFVAVKRGRRRVLARSARDFRSPEKAMEAIDDLRNTESVHDTTEDAFQLPATSFRIVSGVVPLMVSEFPVEDSPAAERRALGRAANGAPGEPAAQTPAAGTAAAPAAPAAAKRAAGTATKPAPAKKAAKPAASRTGKRPARRSKKAAT